MRQKSADKTRTTVNVSMETHDRLLKYGAKAETFDQIIQRALDALDKEKK